MERDPLGHYWCATCNGDATWSHILRRDSEPFYIYGKSHTLAGFWYFCDTCESLYDEGRQEELIERKANLYGPDVSVKQIEKIRRVLEAFWKADRGRERILPLESPAES